jgi:hypothetical protein
MRYGFDVGGYNIKGKDSIAIVRAAVTRQDVHNIKNSISLLMMFISVGHVDHVMALPQVGNDVKRIKLALPFNFHGSVEIRLKIVQSRNQSEPGDF